jgi:lambda family phage portal protein
MIWPFNKGSKPTPKPGSKAFGGEMLRQATQDAMEAFKLGRRDRPREAFQPNGFSGDAAIMGSQDIMNRRSRDLVRNTPQAKRLKRVLTNLVIGKGMQTYAWPFLPSEMFQIVTELDTISQGTFGPRLQYALESDDLYDQYSSDRKQFDVEGRLSGPEMFRMALGEAAIVGNGLMVRVFRRDYNPDKHLVPIAWQMFEREQLDLTQDREAGRSSNGQVQNKIIGGLEINDINQVIAYHLFLDHPYDTFGLNQSMLTGAGAPINSSTRSIRVAADRVIDLALFDRPSSSLGVSWLDAAGQSIWDRDSYMESELRTAAAEAVLLLVAKLKDGSKYGAWGFEDGESDLDEYNNREYKLGHSPVASVIDTDESIELVKPSRPNRDAGPFMKLIDRDIASSVGLSYHSLSGDYESVNFSSSRAAKLDEDLEVGPLQQWFGFACALPVRQTFNQLAIASGRIKSLSPSEFRKSERTYQRFDIIGNGRDLMDPFKEGEARTGRLRTMMSTYKEECARNNKHWIRVLMQKAVEQRVFELFGTTPDFTKSGSGPQGNGSQGQASDNSQAEDSTDDQAEKIADRLSLLLDLE